MAYKVFQNGFPLNASELNNYLMNQSVMVFATATARDTDLTAPLEGMIVWLQDSNKFVYYTGAAWADVDSTYESGNAIINGAMDWWQRGDSFTTSAFAGGQLTADRWSPYASGTGATRTVTKQTFTPGSAPIAGYEAQYFMRIATTVAGSGNTACFLTHRVGDDVKSFAGQTVTLSFFAKASAAATITTGWSQYFGVGGSTGTETLPSGSAALTTSWQRFTFTFAVPSIAGKTIGTGSYPELQLRLPTATTFEIDLWGVQVEAGSVATPFKTNAPSKALEFVNCQKDYYRWTMSQNATVGIGMNTTTTRAQIHITYPTPMRTSPSVIEFSNIQLTDRNSFNAVATAVYIDAVTTAGGNFTVDVASGLTTYRPVQLCGYSGGGYLGLGTGW